MRSIANVDLTVGLVSCPVQMVGVSDSHDRKGSLYHRHEDGSYAKVKMPKCCEGCGEVLTTADISKGFEENGSIVVLSADELETVAANTGTAVNIPQFIKADQVDPMLFAGEQCYRLVPHPKRGSQALATYLTIRQVLVEQELAGVVQYTRWGRNRLGLLVVEPSEDGGVLVLKNLMWPDELRSAEFDVLAGTKDKELDPRLLPVARTLIESMTADWNPVEYTDTYTEALTAAIEAKAAGAEVEILSSEAEGAIDDVSDLLAKLEASTKAPAKKAPARKAAPRKRKVA